MIDIKGLEQSTRHTKTKVNATKELCTIANV